MLIGVQSFTYREYDLETLCEAVAETPIEAIELNHRHLEIEAERDRIDTVRERIGATGLEVCGYGIVTPENPADARAAMEFADRLGVAYLTTDLDPAKETTLDAFCAAADEHGIELAIHNHGPGTVYDTVEDVMTTLEDRSPILGACLDIKHFLRSEQPMDRVVPRLGHRTTVVHAKDYDRTTRTEPIFGDGDTDIDSLIDLLKKHGAFDGPFIVEYDAPPDDPTPAVEEAASRLLNAWTAADGA